MEYSTQGIIKFSFCDFFTSKVISPEPSFLGQITGYWLKASVNRGSCWLGNARKDGDNFTSTGEMTKADATPPKKHSSHTYFSTR